MKVKARPSIEKDKKPVRTKSPYEARFLAEYGKLNRRQKEAVDTIEGPVLVVAGPGTGKTQVLTLRIANILRSTDTPLSGILALTFTNSGVRAMRGRLSTFIGAAASHLTISTFHKFCLSLIEEFYEELGLDLPPRLLDEHGKVMLFDELLENADWQHMRTRSGGAHNFDDLKSLISLLKQECISPADFLSEVTAEQKRIQEDKESLSSRGPSKGEMKATAKEKMGRLDRTKEATGFFALYEQTKKERGLCDYDDVLEYATLLVRRSKEARDTIRERYLYILIDEHQDSAGVQNEFLEAVWGGVERPNVFAVGDDRQLIFGFGGASLSHFERFGKVFPGTRVIALTENYRSSQPILDTAHELLKSAIVAEPLKSTSAQTEPPRLIEAEYPRDEILRAALEIRRRIQSGTAPEECALIVPKRAQAESAVATLRDFGLPVAVGERLSLFSLPEARSLFRLLHLLAAPLERELLAKVLLDPIFGIPFISAQAFIKRAGRALSLESLSRAGEEFTRLRLLLDGCIKKAGESDICALLQHIGAELFWKDGREHDAFLRRIEVIRTLLHVALQLRESDSELDISGFLGFLERLQEYGESLPLAVFSGGKGVRVMTLHASKGLEFDFVWIAHLDENSLMRGKQLRLTLPESLKERVYTKDELAARRELYVGMTRARRSLTLSYARSGYAGTEQQLATALSDAGETLLRSSAEDTEQELLAKDPLVYVQRETPETVPLDEAIASLVKERFAERPLAVTHLNNFWSCPWKWYFRNFLEIPEPESESLKFGSLVHSAIERILREGKPTKRDLPALVEAELDAVGVFAENERRRLRKDSLPVLSQFLDSYHAEFKGALAETKVKPYRDPDFPEIEIGGKIDVIKMQEDGTMLVTDFKTGQVKTRSEIEKRENERMSDHLRQLSMYAYLLAHQKEPMRVGAAELLFLEAKVDDKHARYRTEIRGEHIELLRSEIQEFVRLLLSGEWMRLPCNFKPFGRQKECDYCKLRKTLY